MGRQARARSGENGDYRTMEGTSVGVDGGQYRSFADLFRS